LDIIDTRGDSDNRLFLVYWGQEIKGRKQYLINQELESDKCQKSTAVNDEFEVEFVTDCNVIKWKDYIIDGSNPQGTINTTVQPVRNFKETTAFKRLQGIPKTSKDSDCKSYRTKSTSFGCFSWEPAFHLKDCQSLIDRFWFIRNLSKRMPLAL